jgi:hypothetical protein
MLVAKFASMPSIFSPKTLLSALVFSPVKAPAWHQLADTMVSRMRRMRGLVIEYSFSEML